MSQIIKCLFAGGFLTLVEFCRHIPLIGPFRVLWGFELQQLQLSDNLVKMHQLLGSRSKRKLKKPSFQAQGQKPVFHVRGHPLPKLDFWSWQDCSLTLKTETVGFENLLIPFSFRLQELLPNWLLGGENLWRAVT